MNNHKKQTWGAKLKEFLYEFYAQILMQNNFSFTLWFLSYLLSFLQVFDYTLHPFIEEMTKESFVSSVILNFVEYSSLRPILSNQTLGLVVMVAATVLIIYQIIAYLYFFISVSLLFCSTRKITKMPGLSVFFVIFNIYSLVLFYPTTLVYFLFFSPMRGQAAGHPERIGQQYIEFLSVPHIIISIVIMLLWVIAFIIQIITALLTTEISTQRLVSWSSVEPYTRITLMLIKVYQAFMLSFFDAPPIVEICVVSILGVCLALVRLGTPVSTTRRVHLIESFGDSFYASMCIYILTTKIWGAINCSLPLAIVFAACISSLYIVWLNRRLYKLLALPYVMHLKKSIEAYNYICSVEILLESKDEKSRGLLSGIALNHNRICDNVTCWCQDVKSAMSSKGNDPGHSGEVRDTPPLSIEAEKAGDYQSKVKIGRWLLSLQSDIMVSQNNSLMNIMMSYIYYFYIGNTYQSLNYLDIAETYKPSFLEGFAIYIHRRRIEAAIMFAHEINLFEGAIPIDIMNTLEFSTTYNTFLEIIQECANAYQDFWKELMKDIPDSTKLSNYGKEISEKWKRIQTLFNNLLTLMPKNMNYLYLFGLFIKYIANDTEEAKKIHQKLVYIRNSKSHLKGPEYEKFQDEGRSMMFRVSGSRDSIGRIKEVNMESEKLLGYTRKELEGSKINKMMCNALADTHDGFITRFYETLISNKVNHSTYQYIKASDNFFIPVQMLVRVVPSIAEGLEFCCLCYRNENNPYVSSKVNKTRNRVGTIICDEQFRVLGITRSTGRTLKLPFSLIQKGFPDHFVNAAFPMLKDENVRNKLFESRGRVINYNYERIQEFYADDEEGKSATGQENKYSKKDDILIWMRLVRQDFNDSKAVLILILIDQIPNMDSANYIAYEEHGCQFFMNPSEGAGPKVAAILPQIFRMNSEFDKRMNKGNKNPFEYAESVFAESMLESLPSTASQSSTSLGTITKDITTFKERISESEDPPSVRRLRIMLIIFVIFIIAIVITELTINLIVTKQLGEQFTFVGYLADRLTTLFLAGNRVRTFSSLLNTDPFKPKFSEEDFTASKNYILQYAENIVISHQKIVQVEENLNLYDGAKPITLLYKNKYMENEESSINYSFAIMEFVVKMLQLITYDSLKAALQKITNDAPARSLYSRTRDFLVYNSNMSLRVSSEEIVDKYLGILKSQADTGKIYEIVLNSVSLGVIVILFFLVVPIVIKVVGEKSRVMKGFAYVSKKEIGDIMSWASAFNTRYSAKSLKLLAETRKDKVYAIMQVQKEQEASKEAKDQDEDQERSNKLRCLIRTLFKFDDDPTPKVPKGEEPIAFENSLPDNKSSLDENAEADMDNTPAKPEKDDKTQKENKENAGSPGADESALQLEQNGEPEKKFDEEKILHKRKKDSLSKIDLSLRRRALLKVSFIFILFILYSILNIVYITMFHTYALMASNQYNDMQMRRPTMSQIILMCRQAFFENDTHYLAPSSNSSLRFLFEYNDRLLGIEESILDFEKSGPQFIFPNYIRKLSRYNGDQFCNELQTHIGNDNNCNTYDNSFFKNGLRASQFRFITFWQSIAKRFLKEYNITDARLASYRYSDDITNTINGELRYTDVAIQDLIDTFDFERKRFLKVVEGISWGKAMAMIFILLMAFILVFLSFLKQLKEEISLTKAMMKMIPVDLLQANTKLLHKVLRGSA